MHDVAQIRERELLRALGTPPPPASATAPGRRGGHLLAPSSSSAATPPPPHELQGSQGPSDLSQRVAPGEQGARRFWAPWTWYQRAARDGASGSSGAQQQQQQRATEEDEEDEEGFRAWLEARGVGGGGGGADDVVLPAGVSREEGERAVLGAAGQRRRASWFG